jgi:hypothetical protein
MWEVDKMKKEIEIHKGVGLDLKTSIFVKKQLFNNKNDNEIFSIINN